MRFWSADGLMSSSNPDNVALWNDITARHEAGKADWRTLLREMGVKFAHPDDGWVEREAEEPYVSVSWYPLFDDRPDVGDLIALGYPNGDHWICNGQRGLSFAYRLCRVTRVERGGRLIPYSHYYFEDTGDRLPPLSGLERWRERRAWRKRAKERVTMIAAAARLRRLLARRRCPLCRARVPDVEAHLGLYHTAAEQRQADERTKP